jgi:hypothetical protein
MKQGTARYMPHPLNYLGFLRHILPSEARHTVSKGSKTVQSCNSKSDENTCSKSYENTYIFLISYRDHCYSACYPSEVVHLPHSFGIATYHLRNLPSRG